MEWIDERDHFKGVVLEYLNGETFEQDGQLLKSETTITVTCDPDAPQDSKPIFDNESIRDGTKVYFLVLKSKHACIKK